MSTSAAQYFRLTPLDVALFRDARPFRAEEAETARLSAELPPQLTVFGAMRDFLLQQTDTSYNEFGHGQGPASVGSGPNHPGSLALGPILWGTQEGTSVTAIFPPPADLCQWEKSTETGVGLQLPSPALGLTSLPHGMATLSPTKWTAAGNLRLIEPADETKVEPGVSVLLQKHLETYLTAQELAFISHTHHLCSREVRVGIERNPLTRTASEGRLYSAELVRPHTSLPKSSSFYSLPIYSGAEDLPQHRSVIALGGERRPFELSSEPMLAPIATGLRQKVAASLLAGDGEVTFRIYLLSSAPPGPDPSSGWKPWLPAIENTTLEIFAAAVPRSQWLSGWSVGRPLAARPHIPAGAVYFIRAKSALERSKTVENIMNAFWEQPALCPVTHSSIEDRLECKAGHGITLVGAIAHAQ